ncbi:hypothetical protein R6Z07M_007181 [Ovis aries]
MGPEQQQGPGTSMGGRHWEQKGKPPGEVGEGLPPPGPWRSGAVPGGRAFHNHPSTASRVPSCACRPLLRAPACPRLRATRHVDGRGPRARGRIPLLEPAVPRTSREAFQLPLPQELFADLARSSSGGGRGFSKQLRGSRSEAAWKPPARSPWKLCSPSTSWTSGSLSSSSWPPLSS